MSIFRYIRVYISIDLLGGRFAVGLDLHFMGVSIYTCTTIPAPTFNIYLLFNYCICFRGPLTRDGSARYYLSGKSDPGESPTLFVVTFLSSTYRRIFY